MDGAVADVVAQHETELRACEGRLLVRHPGFVGGYLELRWTVADGAVVPPSVTVRYDTVQVGSFERCVRRALGSWSFPDEVSGEVSALFEVGDVRMSGSTSEVLTSCYGALLRTDPHASGRIELAWNVRDGRVVSEPEVLSDTLGSLAVTACLRDAVQHWTFDVDATGPMSWPFLFQPKP